MCTVVNTLIPEWLASNFSSQYHSWIKHYSHENKGNDNQLKNFLIVQQILLASTLGTVKKLTIYEENNGNG